MLWGSDDRMFTIQAIIPGVILEVALEGLELDGHVTDQTRLTDNLLFIKVTYKVLIDSLLAKKKEKQKRQ